MVKFFPKPNAGTLENKGFAMGAKITNCYKLL